jgi:hypothetical protein
LGWGNDCKMKPQKLVEGDECPWWARDVGQAFTSNV